jgi:hypothetical protein
VGRGTGLKVKIGKIGAGFIAIALLANVVRNARAETPEQEQAAQDLRDAEAAGKRHSAELMKIPHVQAVTGELDGRNEAAILIEVDDPKNVDSVMRQVPSRLEGFPVEIDENAPEIAKGGSMIFLKDDAATPTPPTIDKNGYYHHIWLKPSAPETKPDAQP